MRGDLTIHGVTRSVTVRVEAAETEGGWLVRGEMVVSLSDYGIPDPSIILNKVRDEVDAAFEIRFRTPEPGQD